MENNKTQAEIYREERKERLAKAAAKQANKSPKISKKKKLAAKVIAIVLAVAVGLGAIGGVLNFFGVPQKVLTVSIGDSDYKFSVAEYNYYYYNVWYNYYSTANQYDSYYGEGTGASLLGYDYTTAPTLQEYKDSMSSMTGITLEDIGNPENPTWADVFSYAAISQMLQVKFGAEKATETGITLTEEQEEELEKSIEEVRETAESNDYSVDRWFHTQIGKGLSEKIIREIQNETYLASAYYEKLQTDMRNAVTDEEINTEYAENSDKYDILTARIYTFTPVDVEVADDATAEEIEAANEKSVAATKAKAEAFLNSFTTEAEFIEAAKKDILSEDNDSETDPDESTLAETNYAEMEGIDENLAKWAYDDARKVGDKAVIEGKEGLHYVIFMTTLPQKDMSISSSDVRHILVQFETKTDDEGKTIELTDSEKATYKAKAQSILDEYLKNPTEENFAALATEKTADTSSAESGGLYENVTDDGTYVEEFTEWAVNSSRKPGDTGIVETTYGYHIMYYVEANGDAWYETVKDAIFTEEFAAVTDDVMLEIMATVNYDGAVIGWAKKNQSKFINKIVVQNT